MKTHSDSFIWFELMTTDATAAAKFYGAVVGWKIALEPSPGPDGKDYRMIGRSDGGNAGGVLQLADVAATWLPYFYVPDVDAALTRINASGGKALMPATDIPVGRLAMASDPMGTPFYVMTPKPPPTKPEAKSDVFHPSEPQRVVWNELQTPDLKKAKAFYAEQFGLSFDKAMPMGELGDYVFLEEGGLTQGGVMQENAKSPTQNWVPYFGVPSAVQAQTAIEKAGGTVLMPVHEVPGGGFVVLAKDPQGAVFGVSGPK